MVKDASHSVELIGSPRFIGLDHFCHESSNLILTKISAAPNPPCPSEEKYSVVKSFVKKDPTSNRLVFIVEPKSIIELQFPLVSFKLTNKSSSLSLPFGGLLISIAVSPVLT
jgi:hypothetical protein